MTDCHLAPPGSFQPHICGPGLIEIPAEIWRLEKAPPVLLRNQPIFLDLAEVSGQILDSRIQAPSRSCGHLEALSRAF